MMVMSVCVNDNFLWEDINNYSIQSEVFTGMCGPQNSAQGVTDIVHIFIFFNGSGTENCR
jgi:hypothetical protein